MNDATTELSFQLMIIFPENNEALQYSWKKENYYSAYKDYIDALSLPLLLSNTAASLNNVPQQTRRSTSAHRSLAEWKPLLRPWENRSDESRVCEHHLVGFSFSFSVCICKKRELEAHPGYRFLIFHIHETPPVHTQAFHWACRNPA
jgi:hypothetical protein